MELKQYFAIIYKKLWIVILLPLIAAGISAYLSYYVFKPVYESSTTLFVTNTNLNPGIPIAYNDIMVSQQLVKDYRELVKSKTVTKTVIDQLGLKDISPDTLAGKVAVSSKNDTRLIQIKVQDTDPTKARDIADSISNVFIDKVIDIMRVENVGVVDKAEVPVSPVKPNHKLNILIAIFIGLLAGVGIVLLIDYMDDTIKTTEDVEKYLELTVLGTIPAMSIE